MMEIIVLLVAGSKVQSSIGPVSREPFGKVQDAVDGEFTNVVEAAQFLASFWV
jgi:hypothetical protein